MRCSEITCIMYIIVTHDVCLWLQSKDEQEGINPTTSADVQDQPFLPQATAPHLHHKVIPITYRQTSTHNHVNTDSDNKLTLQKRSKIKKEMSMKSLGSSLNASKGEVKTSAGGGRCSMCRGTGVFVASHSGSLEGDRVPLTTNGSLSFLYSYHLPDKQYNVCFHI